jgi:hypothetical protein
LPVTGKVFGISQDEEVLQRLIRHTTDVLAHGIAVPPASLDK